MDGIYARHCFLAVCWYSLSLHTLAYREDFWEARLGQPGEPECLIPGYRFPTCRVSCAFICSLFLTTCSKVPRKGEKRVQLKMQRCVPHCINPDSCSVVKFDYISLYVVNLTFGLVFDFMFVNYCPKHD